jgi:hypothetical protein
MFLLVEKYLANMRIQCRERSFTLSPLRPGGFQPQGFSRATRGFVKELPESIKRAYDRVRRPR